MRPRRDRSLHDRVVWQSASLLLAYPDDGHAARLRTAADLIGQITGAPAALLGETLAALRGAGPMALATQYVDTFDLRKQTTMLLTYWTGGDTRNRGVQMVAFTQAYRAAGVAPPKHEAPDHLPVVLEFAATVDPVAAAGCSPTTVCRSTCCAGRWSMPARRTPRRSRPSAQPCPASPKHSHALCSEPARPGNRWGWSRSN